MNTKRIYITLLLSVCFFTYSFAFPLISENVKTKIAVGESEDKVVYTALDIFCSDMQTVSGDKPEVRTLNSDCSVWIGTIGKNELINKLIDTKQINTQNIEGRWEAFQIQTITYNGKKILVVIGSDSRGTAYGILHLSRMIGVSPWVWWADVTPKRKTSLNLPDNFFVTQQPSVQYRGIFLNDEDWGLMPWSNRIFEPSEQKGRIGPKTYAKIFELLLRLRANTIWPAMHESTVPFYFVDGNMEMADKYGIVVGTSHCEPLMRNSAGEWDAKKMGDYNYLTNKNTVCNYWSERLAQAGTFENFYTIGMRGVHDGKMEGVKTLDEQTSVLNQVIKDQRELLKKHVDAKVESIPQTFVPYKEVLSIYENGLHVPDDITLTWCDDNYGYITRLSNSNEQKRGGGAGVYYHISYWGRPHDYLWLCTTSPAQIYWQMRKAWDTGARKLWILNVGDIKPSEYDTELFLDMAWDIESVQPNNIYNHLQLWCAREFGEENAIEISEILNEYYRLANIRKPEFMGWSRVEEFSVLKGGKTAVIDTEFNPYIFGDEIERRLSAYKTISDKALELAKKIPDAHKSAYFQLVEYPICASAEMNKKLLYAQKARLYASCNLPVANEYSAKSTNAYNAIAELTYTYNQDFMNGKWKLMMDMNPRDLYVFQPATLPGYIPATNKNDLVLWAENQSAPTTEKTITLTPFVKNVGEQTFVSILSCNGKNPTYEIIHKPDWLTISETPLSLQSELRLDFVANYTKLLTLSEDSCVMNINGKKYLFKVQAHPSNGKFPLEYNKMIILNPSDYQPVKNIPIAIQGLGYTKNALQLNIGKKNALTYKVHTSSTGNALIRTCLLPNHPIKGNDMRYAIAIDKEKPQIVSFKTEFRSERWKINVLRNQSVNITQHYIDKPGEHTITIYALDDGVILDQLLIDFNLDRKYYSIPFYK